MFKQLTNWWNKDKIELQRKLDEMTERFDNLQLGMDNKMSECDSLKAELKFTKLQHEMLVAEMTKLISEFESFKENHPDMKAEGVLTPWFVVGVDGENELKGLKTYVDWNDAMIQHMKDKNLGYKTDDEMIQHFLVQLYEHVLMLIDAKVIDDSDIPRKNEFE